MTFRLNTSRIYRSRRPYSGKFSGEEIGKEMKRQGNDSELGRWNGVFVGAIV